jgi:hypothetical protein
MDAGSDTPAVPIVRLAGSAVDLRSFYQMARRTVKAARAAVDAVRACES